VSLVKLKDRIQVSDPFFLNNHNIHLEDIPQSQMFDIKSSFKKYINENPNSPVYDASQGDGGASLPGVPKEILLKACELLVSNGTGYGSPIGTEIYRKSVLEDYWKLDSKNKWNIKNVASCCGGRDALIKAYTAMQHISNTHGGFVLVPKVPWISYKWGPYSVGSNVLHAPGDESECWKLTKAGIKESVDLARSVQREVTCVVLTSPDNPTGRHLDVGEMVDLARYALSIGVHYVLFDLIYHWICDYGPYDINKILSFFTEKEQSRLVFLDGVTKSLGGSNIRNAHLLADEKIIQNIKRRSSHGVIPGFFGEAVAITAYKSNFADVTRSIREPISESRAITKEFCEKNKIKAFIGQGYYAFINVRDWIVKSGLKDSSELGVVLARKHGFAIIPGYYFSEHASDWIRFSYALPPNDAEKNLNKLHELWIGDSL